MEAVEATNRQAAKTAEKFAEAFSEFYAAIKKKDRTHKRRRGAQIRRSFLFFEFRFAFFTIFKVISKERKSETK